MQYGDDLAYIHHTAFGSFADEAAPGLIARLHHAGIRHGLVVDLACGSGIWARHLLDAGFDVVGIDASPAMIEIARTVAPRAHFIVGSAHTVDIPPCAAVTAIGEGLTYLTSDVDDLDLGSLFRRVHNALRPRGLFIFDVVERSVETPMSYDASQTGSDWTLEVAVVEDSARRLLTRRIAIRRSAAEGVRWTTEVHYVRTFDRGEVETLLRTAGFDVELTLTYGARALLPQRIAFFAQKRPCTTDRLHLRH
jgi:SAM-dependent methyltransferase